MDLVNEELLGTWVSQERGLPELVFEASGVVSGSDGCNRIVSTYEATEAGARVAPFAITAMACMGVNQWLADVASVTLDDGVLRVRDVAGTEIGELQRSE